MSTSQRHDLGAVAVDGVRLALAVPVERLCRRIEGFLRIEDVAVGPGHQAGEFDMPVTAVLANDHGAGCEADPGTIAGVGLAQDPGP